MTWWRKRLRWWRLDLELYWLEHHFETLAAVVIVGTVAYLFWRYR